MFSPDIQILIPCHSLEDFPTEQTDEPAASLLNAFAVAYHPALLAWAGEIPRWRRADDPPLPRRGQLVIIPMVCDGWLPHGWADDARRAGATVVSGLFDRQKMLEAALVAVGTETDDPLPEAAGVDALEVEGNFQRHQSTVPGDIDADLVADFLSLGTCWLLIELLTRKMRQFGNIDETRFFQRAQAGAKAAIADDRETAETHLRACFEILLEARERFYPVDCYLLDLCLALPDVAHEKLLPDSQQNVPWSLMVSTEDLTSICEKTPELKPALTDAWNAGRISIVGGEDREAPLPLLPLESALYHFSQGRVEWKQLLGRAPIVWGRRKFGLSALMPQILAKFGFLAALHVVLDDGIYPDAEYTKLRWRGADGTLIDALSRIPLAAEGAASYLRFPARMSESMDHDQVAGLILARWPEIDAPWFEDFRRSQKYAPCLGRFVTLDRFFEQTELPGQLSVYKANEYFSPFLIQHVARREQRPISRYVEHANQRRRFDAASWYHATARALLTKPVDQQLFHSIEKRLEADRLVRDSVLDDELAELEQTGLSELSRIIMHSSKSGRGFLVMNSLSFTRRVVVALPGVTSPPVISGAVKAVEFDAAHPERTACVVEIPGSGFAWFPAASGEAVRTVPKQPLAENWLLRNDHFEVAINERTGGIAHVRFHDQRTKRLSQQLSFRFPRERTISVGAEPGDTSKSQYAEMKCRGHEIRRSGTACGEIVTTGEIIDQVKGERLASYCQTVRVWRACPTIEIEIELTDVKVPDGDPWNNYFASRFAWNDGTAAVTRSIYHSAQSFSGERFETSDYIEIASENERLTIVPHGLPFHRQTGDRMVDSLLVVAGEDELRFRFTIAVDAPYPLEAAWNALTPVTVVPTETGPPRAGLTGWFFHMDSRNIQATRILDPRQTDVVPSPLEHCEHFTVPNGPGFMVRLLETEGRAKQVKLRCFRVPTFACKRDFKGDTISELLLEGDAVVIEMTAYEVADIELRFGEE
jgi:alpha-mannosidase